MQPPDSPVKNCPKCGKYPFMSPPADSPTSVYTSMMRMINPQFGESPPATDPPAPDMVAQTEAETAEQKGEDPEEALRATLGHIADSPEAPDSPPSVYKSMRRAIWGTRPDEEGTANIEESETKAGSGVDERHSKGWSFGPKWVSEKGAEQVQKIAFPVPDRTITEAFLRQHRDLLFIETVSGDRIPCLHIKKKTATHTLIYSHGNGEDLGYVIKVLHTLSISAKPCTMKHEHCTAPIFS